MSFHFSFWIPLYFLLHQNEVVSALDQLKERASKREAKLRIQKEKKEGEERKLQRVREKILE